MSADIPVIEIEEGVKLKKMYMEVVHLGAIKIIVSFSMEDRASQVDVGQPLSGFGASTFAYSAMSKLVNISDSPLSFKELIITDVFTSADVLGA